MIDVCRTTILQALADLICLSVILYLEPDVSPVRIVVGYFAVKVIAFGAYRMGMKA